MTHIHRTGLIDPLFVDVALTGSVPARTLHIGDLVAKDANASPAGLVSAAQFTWDTDKATTQAEFVTAFRGLCDGESKASSIDGRQLNVPVLQDGDVEFDCVSATYTQGQFVGPTKGSGNTLINTVEGVSDKAHAVAIVTKDSGASAVSVTARLLNTIVKH